MPTSPAAAAAAALCRLLMLWTVAKSVGADVSQLVASGNGFVYDAPAAGAFDLTQLTSAASTLLAPPLSSSYSAGATSVKYSENFEIQPATTFSVTLDSVPTTLASQQYLQGSQSLIFVTPAPPAPQQPPAGPAFSASPADPTAALYVTPLPTTAATYQPTARPYASAFIPITPANFKTQVQNRFVPSDPGPSNFRKVRSRGYTYHPPKTSFHA